jgi:nucleoside-triphosphatase THEP1
MMITPTKSENNYKGRVDHYKKIKSRKQRADIGSYSFLNRTVQLWNQLPVDDLGTVSYKSCNFRKMVRKLINRQSEVVMEIIKNGVK